MARDHYVAQTYLRRFGDPERDFLMHGYLKVPLKDFPCRPRNVCHEWDGDLNADFITNRPELRSDFRSMCEPYWDSAVDRLLSAKLSHDDKLAMAQMAATLMTCTPAWRRVAVDTWNSFAKGTALASYDLTLKAGKIPEIEAEAIELLREGHLRVETDPKYIEAKSTRGLLDHARLIYNQPWTVLYNASDFPFVTSDNPFALLTKYPRRLGVTRFLPITPRVCLEVPFLIDLEPEERKTAEFDLDEPPKGGVSYAMIAPLKARAINRLIVQCAEKLVLANTPDEGVRRLVEKYAAWGVEQEFVEFPVVGENAVYQGTILHVRERRAA